MSIIAAARAQYPNPITVPKLQSMNRATDYCVGGALCCYVARTKQGSGVLPSPFPPEKVLAFALVTLNPALTVGMAREWASAIIAANDDGRFADAWAYAEAATNLCEKEMPL